MIIWANERQLGHHLRGLTPTDTVMLIRGQHLSTIAAGNTRGIEDIEVHNETTNGEMFAGFVQRCIVPIMLPFNGSNPRSVLVLDNASIHHVQEVHQMIDGCGAIIEYLPAYSPDFNPLEEVFAQVKHFLKRNNVSYHCISDPRVLRTAAFCSILHADCVNF